MAPRVTLLTSTNGNSTARTWSTLEQSGSGVSANGTDTQMDVDEVDELSEMDEADSLEVDELDESDSGPQDSQPQWETISSASASAAPSPKASAKKPRPKPPTTRQPGQTIVPMSRIEAMVSTDLSQHGTPSKEAAFIISLATEEFIRRLTRVAHTRSRLDKRMLTTYNDFADSAHYFEEYKFLQEIIPRPLSPKSALVERKRILEEHDALLNGLNIVSPDSKTKPGQTSASTSKASTPVPKLTKARSASSSANGRSSKSKNAGTATSAPVVRSQRQKNKKARLAQEAVSSAEPTADVNSPAPLPAQNGHATGDPNGVHGSNNSSRSSSMKIKISLRPPSTTPTAVPVDAVSQNTVLPLGPPSRASSTGTPERQHSQQLNESTDKPLRFEEDAKSGTGSNNLNGKTGGVQFAPVNVETTDQPLWNRVPLPPPPSAKVTTSLEVLKNGTMTTDLDTAVEQARNVRAAKPRSARQDASNGLPRDEQKVATNGAELEDSAPPPKRARQRRRSGESTSSKGGLRDALNGTIPNPGRTIYSQR
ncbi:uncharacterized protein FOMMEDRAFT_24111 [Fomitiporia mediterranea MF3/22]|uniref:uncharacterized protein n=1 Tax=Fomitiporia mediterranea (strain MF3/22) TaxID=694068 RepID=UPI0004408C2D|nr:uncharacterized protein FOMMEDRAFT_24111 [Fomitiporia mediterranea MF3/22]EJC98111.1 hypothetical protein FOMMEDRAFT_24111 [Fomitiporia mediterranea MF3/22]